MEICILNLGKFATNWIKDGFVQYQSRILRYIKFTEIIIPDLRNTKSLSKEIIKEEEGKEILKQILPSDFVVLMDERGSEYTSIKFSDWINKQMNTGRKRLLFVIGGPYGFSQSVYKRADSLVSLSKMTFTHEMAKLFLAEQIYRAFSILKGEPYHHD